MATKTTFICDCCLRESDNNVGWARVSINGISDGKQIIPDEDRDLCEICWSPLQTLMKKVRDDARATRGSSNTQERFADVILAPTNSPQLLDLLSRPLRSCDWGPKTGGAPDLAAGRPREEALEFGDTAPLAAVRKAITAARKD